MPTYPFLIAGLAGVLSASCFLASGFGTIGGSIVSVLAQLPLFLVGLSAGVIPVLIAMIVACCCVVFTGSLEGVLVYGLMTGLPVVLIIHFALMNRPAAKDIAWYPEYLLLSRAVQSALLITLVVQWLIDSKITQQGGIQGFLEHTLDQASLAQLTQSNPTVGATIRQQMERLLPYFPGFAGASWLALFIMNGALAQGLLLKFGRNLRPAPQMKHLEIEQWAYVALAVAAIAVTLGSGVFSQTATNLGIVLLLSFAFSGLGVVHSLCANFANSGGMVLGLFYMTLLGFVGWVLLPVAILGLFEPWLQLKHKFLKNKDAL